MAELRLTLFGGFQAQLAGGPPLTLPTKKGQALLAYLALRLGQACPRAKVAGLLWPDMDDERARNNLRQTLFSIRPSLSPCLLTEGETVGLRQGTVDVDVDAFERFAAEGSLRALEKAAALYQGDLLDGFAIGETPFDEWLGAERERLRAAAIECLARLLEQQMKAEATASAIQTALRMLALDALQEPAHRALMNLYASQGRRAAALKQYQACVEMLRGTLGVDPEVETRQLYQTILQRRTVRQPQITREERSAVSTGAPEIRLVGRQRELLTLREAMEEAWRSRGVAVMITGDAGIGKTRLAEEIAGHAARMDGQVLLGRCHESERILPFGPWVDAIRSAHVLEDPDLLAGLATPWRSELARLFPEAASPQAERRSEPAEYLRLFEAIARLLERLSTRKPLLLALEDLHWADEMSVRLLPFIGRRVHRWRALVVGTARAEELPEATALRHAMQELRKEQRLRELSLTSLSPDETRTLVHNLRQPGVETAVAAALGEQVWAMSDGNPFMIVETVRALQTGALPATGHIALPERIRHLLTERLDRLAETSRSLAAIAAIIGREFDFALLQSASRLDERRATEAVEELVRRRVLRVTGERFQFVHDWIREVADDRVLPPTRAVLHRSVAEALEGLYADDLEARYAALAIHYDKGEVWPKALTYLRLAALQAAARSAHGEAVSLLERALLVLARLPESRSTVEQAIDLRFDLRNSLVPLGRYRSTVDFLREAESLAEAIADQRRLARALSFMTEQLFIVGEPERAIRSGERALVLAEACGDLAIKVTANRQLGRAYYVIGDHRRALERLEWLVATLTGDLLHERFDSPPIASVNSRVVLAWCLADLGEFDKALARSEEALRVAEAADHPLSIINACTALGVVLFERGEISASTALLERGLSLINAWGLATWFPLVASTLGAAHAAAGRVAEAVPLLEQAVDTAQSMGRMEGQSVRVAYLADAYSNADRLTDAVGLARQALALAREHKERGREARALRYLGDIQTRDKHSALGEIEGHYRECLALAEALGMRPLAAHCHLGFARLMQRAGRRADAEAHRTAAGTLYRDMGMVSDLRRLDGIDVR